jgi:hypothetical protein
MTLETAAIEWALARSAVLRRVTDVGARRYQRATRALIQEIGELTAGPQRHSLEHLVAVEHHPAEMDCRS